jgi:1,5-anhydro-D-fructose reductase (1,5-anhydro-D-mannitol-forming)
MSADWSRREMILAAAGGAAFPRRSRRPEGQAEPKEGTSPGPTAAGRTGAIKIALLGAAHVHTPSFLRLIAGRPDYIVSQVWDSESARGKEAAQTANARVCADRKEIWADPELAAVVVLSETVRHRELVLEAAAAKKHIFVEKPLGTGRQDSSEMAAAVAKAGITFQTGYFMRGEPVYLFLREQIQKGVFGKITRLRLCVSNAGSLEGMFAKEYRWMTDPKQAGVGGFGDIGTHALDLLLWYWGEPVRVAASFQPLSGSPGDGNENGEAILEFKNGVSAVISAGWLDVDNPMPVYVGGTTGCAYKLKDRFYFQSEAVEGADGRRAWNKFPPAWAHPLELFLDAVAGKPDVPLVTAGEAATRCAVMEAICKAGTEHRWIEI